MKTQTTWVRYPLVGLLCLTMFVIGWSQQRGAGNNSDTISSLVITQERMQNQRAEATDTVIGYQLRKLKEYSVQVNRVVDWLKRGVDTIGLSSEINNIEQELMLSKRGVFVKASDLNNFRNLKSSLILMESTNDRLNTLESKLESISLKVFEFQRGINAIRNDTMMRRIPEDELLATEYFRRIEEVRTKALPAVRQLQRLALGIGTYQNHITQLQLESQNDVDEVKGVIKSFNQRILNRDVPLFFKPIPGSMSLWDSIKLSYEKAQFTFRIYFNQNWPGRIWILFVFVLFWFSGRMAIRSLEKMGKVNAAQLAKNWFHYPALSALFISIGLGQFFYEDAPAVYIQYLWMAMAIVGTIIFYREFTSKSKHFWMAGLFLLLLVSLDNLIVQVTTLERVWVMVIGLAGLFLVLWFFKMISLPESGKVEMPLLRVLMALFIIQQSISFLANVSGHYTLAKMMMIGGYFNFLNGVFLWWMVILLSDFVFIIIEAARQKESWTPYFNFTRISEGTRPVLNTIMIILWAIIFLKNINLYAAIFDWFSDVLAAERSIGNFTFSLGSILIFFVVLYVASLLSKVVSFVLGSGHQTLQSRSRSRFGGSVLILKLVILTFGFLVAVAAAGIPLDKITIIIGALGVGIGFGLQHIVANLISGIIIAFEKPINIGDQIEVGGRLGRVMEIGIRSSKLATFDGAEVIIPNGDILNQHVVNWTLSSNNRRVEILVGVKFGTDLDLVQQLLYKTLEGKEHIIQVPAPAVLIHEFGACSINFRLLFWTDDIGDWMTLKSTIIQEIDLAFKVNAIEIPFPQQDIYIKEVKGMNLPKTDPD